MNNEYNHIEKIELYLEGKLEGEELAAFEKALSDGPDTETPPGVFVDDYRAAVNAIKVYNKGILKSRLRQIHKDVRIQSAAIKKLRRWYWAAAVVIVVVGVAVATMILTGDERGVDPEDNIVKLEKDAKGLKEETQPDIKDTTKEDRAEKKPEEEDAGAIIDIDDKRLLASNYQKNPKYETLIATIYRAADIKILTPDTTAGFKTNDTIVFSWEGDVDEELIIKIIDNREKPMHEIRLRDVNEYRWSNKLDTGLYYWILETEDDNMGYGRFLIR